MRQKKRSAGNRAMEFKQKKTLFVFFNDRMVLLRTIFVSITHGQKEEQIGVLLAMSLWKSMAFSKVQSFGLVMEQWRAG